MSVQTRAGRRWDESTSAPTRDVEQREAVFESFFERSTDAIWLYDPQAGMVVDCNRAAVELIGAANKHELLPARPEELAPALQADGTPTGERSAPLTALVEQDGGCRFEWMLRHKSGQTVPLEVSSTPIVMGGRNVHIVVSRDISERKRAEASLRDLNLSLERRVAERTAELKTSEARFRALVEHAPEA